MELKVAKTAYEAYGVECGSGWRGLYQPLIDLCVARGITILQVKEKFGGLCFYTSRPTEVNDIDLLITAAESFSLKTCEDCGEHGMTWGRDANERYTSTNKATTGPSETSGWIRTLCEACRKKFDAERTASAPAMKELITNDRLVSN